ncbi:DNA topoisomerase III, partial [Acidithiobacillus caldus]
WKLEAKDDAKAQIKVIRDLLKKADVVVNAGDPDREGQLLVDEVLEELGWKGPTQRIWLAALDEQSVKKALSSIRDNREYQNLCNAARARSRADWLVGMNLSRAFTLRNSGGGVVSIGRVQTPTLALIVARDEKI